MVIKYTNRGTDDEMKGGDLRLTGHLGRMQKGTRERMTGWKKGGGGLSSVTEGRGGRSPK
jgi:hypothetical protein